MIEVCMSEDYGVDRLRIDGKPRPIALAQDFQSLEQAAIDKQPRPFHVEQVP
jgi:hypothetical protein